MKRISLAAASLAALGAALASPSFAQTTQAAGTGLTMPYQRDFWGHVGASIGRSELRAGCPVGAPCDRRDEAWRIFGGGRFNNTFGGEIAWVDFGDFTRGGGRTEARAIDLALIAGFPFMTNSSVFGKLGGAYTRTEVSGTVPGFETGTRNRWGWRFGAGAQIGLTPNWALRLDIDRYRVRLPEGRDNIDTLMIGAQYSFR
jgi:OmpA-OmpF porin, OOP family